MNQEVAGADYFLNNVMLLLMFFDDLINDLRNTITLTMHFQRVEVPKTI